MTERLSRREFLKRAVVIGAGVAAAHALRPLEILKAQERPLHLDAIESADLNPGGKPLFTRKEGEGVLEKPEFALVKASISDSLSATAKFIEESKDERLKSITNVTAVVSGHITEKQGEVTVTPTPPTESGKSIPVLVTARGFGFYAQEGQVSYYDNTQVLNAMGVTDDHDPRLDRLYIFPTPDGELVAADYNEGTVFASGEPGHEGKIEWAPIETISLENADIQLSSDLTTISINGKEYPVNMLPKSVSINTPTKSFVHPNWGVQELESVKEKLYGLTGIVVGTDTVDLPVPDPSKMGQDVAIEVDRLYMVIPVKRGAKVEVFKARLLGSGDAARGYLISHTGQEWGKTVKWAELKGLLVPGDQIEATVHGSIDTEGIAWWCDGDEVCATKVTAWNNFMPDRISRVKNLTKTKNSGWTDLGGWASVIVGRSQPQVTN